MTKAEQHGLESSIRCLFDAPDITKDLRDGKELSGDWAPFVEKNRNRIKPQQNLDDPRIARVIYQMCQDRYKIRLQELEGEADISE